MFHFTFECLQKTLYIRWYTSLKTDIWASNESALRKISRKIESLFIVDTSLQQTLFQSLWCPLYRGFIVVYWLNNRVRNPWNITVEHFMFSTCFLETFGSINFARNDFAVCKFLKYNGIHKWKNISFMIRRSTKHICVMWVKTNVTSCGNKMRVSIEWTATTRQ